MTPEVAGSSPAGCPHAEVAQLAELPEAAPRGSSGGRRFESCPPHHHHHYLVVRSDLPLGDAMAQLAHAAGHTGGPRTVGASVVVLGVPNEQGLLELADKLAGAGMNPIVVREPDAPWCGAAMALGIEPLVRNRRTRRLFGELALYEKKANA